MRHPRRPHRPRRRRRASVAVLLVGVLTLTACNDDAGDGGDARAPDGRVTEPASISVFQLQPGDCLDPDPDQTGELASIPVVPCEQLHGQEVIGVVEHPDVPYPGAAAVAQWADGACLAELETSLDLTLDDGVFISYLLPTFTGWNSENEDRGVVCVVVADDPQGTTGSLVAGTATPPTPATERDDEGAP